MPDYNLAHLSVITGYKYEQEIAYPTIDKLLAEHDRVTKNLSKLTQLIQLVEIEKAKFGDKEPTVNFYNNPAAMSLIDEIREITRIDIHGNTTSFLPPGQYEWKGQSAVDALTKGLEAQTKICTHEIDPIYTKIRQALEDKNHIDTACSKMLNRSTDSIAHILRNMVK